MFDFMAGALAFFYELWPSFPGAIILLTLAIMLVLTPLSIKATRSMLAMSRLQPEMKKLQQQYKDDRQKLNQEMMAFYQENKINPFSSCLPLLLQMPIFIVLYRVIDGLGRVETRDSGARGPKYLEESTRLYQDLAERIVERPRGSGSFKIEMREWGIDFARNLTDVWSNVGWIDALPYVVLVAIVAATGYYQQKQISGRNPNAAANPQQQMIMRLMPAFFAFISISIPAGVVLYFVVSNGVRIGQQGLVTRLETKHHPGPGSDKDGGGKPKDGKDGKAVEAKAVEKPKDKEPTKDGGSRSSSKKSGSRKQPARKPPPRPASSRGKGAGPSPARAGTAAPRPRKKRRK
jgi:YidC/Oxa1 family membrane protein insertase